MADPTKKAIVLAGGGVTGIAWEVGVMTGLARTGVAVAQDSQMIGTSAGSVVCAELANGVPVEALFSRQLEPPQSSGELFQHYSQREVDKKNQALMEKVNGDLTAAHQKIGAFALRSVTPSLDARRAVIRSRLSQTEWPDVPLCLVAVDAQTADVVVLDARSSVDLTDAVMASCAVPGVWPTVPYRGRQLMDGAVRSITNADLAQGSAYVLVLAPLGYGDANPVNGHLRAEIETLESAGVKVNVIVPDERSVLAIGDNVLDPEGRQASAEAGLAQGLSLARTLDPVWRRR